MYVHSNLRLLTHNQSSYKEGDTRRWDIEPEQLDLDASTSHSAALDINDKYEPEVATDHESGSVSATATASGSACASATNAICGSTQNVASNNASLFDSDDPYDSD